MGAGTSAVGWDLLGEEPVPGDPGAIQAAADGYRRAASAAAGAAAAAGRFSGGAQGWTGTAAVSFASAASHVPGRVQVLAEAAERGGVALGEFANVMRTLQATAEDLLGTAAEADQARLAAEEELERLHAAHAAAALAEQATRAALRDAERRANEAEALGDPSAVVLQQEASLRRVAANDAANRVAVLAADIAAAGSAAIDAQARLDAARADAQRLAVEFEGEAASAAARLVPVPPAGDSLFVGLPGIPAVPGSTPPAPVPSPGPATGGGATTAAATASTVGAPTAAASPVGGAGHHHHHDHHHAAAPVSAEDLVRVASALEAVRRGGAPIGPASLTPSLEVFRQYDRLGLQPVAARGAAIARAFGFEGTIGGIGSRAYRSDHSLGLAIDLMTYDDLATGQALADFFLAHREELGVTYVIFDGRIASHVGDWAWRPYRHPMGRTDPTAMHVDHPHISFDPADNAYALAAFGLER